MFYVVTGVDDGGTVIESQDPSLFPVTWAEVVTESNRLIAEYNSKQYQRNRVEGVSGSYAASQGTGSIYPVVTDQLDMIYHELTASGSLTTSGSWYKTIKTVKDANPKP